METTQYDLTVHLQTEDDAVVTDALNAAGATDVSRKEFTKVELARPIKKTGTCFMGIYHLELPAGEVKSLENRLRSLAPCLRHLLVRRQAGTMMTRRRSETREPRHSGEMALTNEALAEKIREIGEAL